MLFMKYVFAAMYSFRCNFSMLAQDVFMRLVVVGKRKSSAVIVLIIVKLPYSYYKL